RARLRSASVDRHGLQLTSSTRWTNALPTAPNGTSKAPRDPDGEPVPRFHRRAVSVRPTLTPSLQRPSSSSRPIADGVPGTPVDPRRVVVEQVRPVVDCAALPAKATAGLALPVSAVLVADGHDPLTGWVWHGPPAVEALEPVAPPRGWRESSLEPLGNDRYAAWVTPPRMGEWAFAI